VFIYLCIYIYIYTLTIDILLSFDQVVLHTICTQFNCRPVIPSLFAADGGRPRSQQIHTIWQQLLLLKAALCFVYCEPAVCMVCQQETCFSHPSLGYIL